MNIDELIKSINKDTCHVWMLVHDLIARVITETEEILGTYLKTEKVEVEIKERKIQTVRYDFYFVTNRNFVRIFASEGKYWFKTCPLNRFMGLEEKNSPKWGGISIKDIDIFVAAGLPGKLQVKMCFDVTDEGLREITLESEEPAENTKIKEFVSDFMTAVSGLHKRLEE